MRPLRIVYVTPDYPSGHSWEGLWAGYLHSNIIKHPDDEAAYFNLFYDRYDHAMLWGRDADIVAMSATSPQYRRALLLKEDIIAQGGHPTFVLGGPHASAVPEQCSKDGWEYVVQGEGEAAFGQIVDGVRKMRKKPVERMQPVDVNKLFFPDRHLIKQERHIQQAFSDENRRVLSIFSGRGCPFNCDFCISKTIWSRRVRLRSPVDIFNEMLQVKHDWDVDFIKFSDDTFTLGKERLIGLSQLIEDYGNPIKFGCNVHPNTTTPEMLKILDGMGCTEIWVGVESGSPKVLKAMRKNSSVERIKQTFKDAKDLGILRRAYILLGHPSETQEDIKMTDALLDEIQPDIVGFTILCPYPGSAHYDPKKHANIDWSKTDEYGNGIWSTEHFSNDDLLGIQQWFVEKWEGHLSYKHAVMGYGKK